jgi:hypothetical protein
MSRRFVRIAVAVVVLLAGLAYAAYSWLTASVLRELSDGRLVAADYWSAEPKILSAGYGFDNIIGIGELTPETVRKAGGAWMADVTCADGSEPPLSARTSAATSDTIALAYHGFADHDDGLPVVFSWPVASETVNPADFRVTLNTGGTVMPYAAGMFPNWELNERNVVVLFGDFGNRNLPTEPDAIYPVKLEIVADSTPLKLIGPDGNAFDAVGLSWTTKDSPYANGPYLVGAKLNRIDGPAAGEGGAFVLERAPYFPNDEFALYGGGNFRLRLLTSGGFSTDGVSALRPDSYGKYFRIHATAPDGSDMLLQSAGKDFDVAGGKLRVVGLSDLGRKAAVYDDCYVEDRDNYIDIILAGDEAAARSIRAVEIPAKGRYARFYNPGGPGKEPFPEVRYTAKGPADVEPVINALDDPMRISREP